VTNNNNQETGLLSHTSSSQRLRH